MIHKIVTGKTRTALNILLILLPFLTVMLLAWHVQTIQDDIIVISTPISRPPDESNKVYLPLTGNIFENGKAGLAYAGFSSRRVPASSTYIGDMQKLHMSWYHKWTACDSRTDKYPGYVFNFACDYAFDNASCISPDYNKPIMFLNEPNMPSQCHKTPEEGVDFYMRLRNDYPDAILVGPAVSHLDYNTSENGQQFIWLRAFYDELEARNLPYPDIADVHSYIHYEPSSYLIDSYLEFLSSYNGATDRLWVGEFARNNETNSYEAISTYDNHPNIERFFWFAPRYSSALLDYTKATNDWTDVGQAWNKYFNP